MSYEIDASQIGAGRKFLRGMKRAAENAQYRAVNRVASKTRTAASKRIRQDVRLKAGYVNQNLKVAKKARREDPTAVIRARRRPTRLARYGAKQLTKRAPEAQGDPLRGIASGRKAAGVAVNVDRSTGRSKMPGAFLIPLQTAGVMGLFIRTGAGRDDIKHLYGPSVDQVFRSVLPEIQGGVSQNLETEYRRQLAFAVRKEAKKL